MTGPGRSACAVSAEPHTEVEHISLHLHLANIRWGMDTDSPYTKKRLPSGHAVVCWFCAQG